MRVSTWLQSIRMTAISPMPSASWILAIYSILRTSAADLAGNVIHRFDASATLPHSRNR